MDAYRGKMKLTLNFVYLKILLYCNSFIVILFINNRCIGIFIRKVVLTPTWNWKHYH